MKLPSDAVARPPLSAPAAAADQLRLLMFESAYLQALIEIGEADADARADDLAALIERP